jgi:glutamyl-tRNA reductase
MTAQKTILFCMGANHNSATIDFREQLYFNPTHLQVAMKKVQDEFGLLEIMGLSTCNRLEIYGVAKKGADNLSEIFVALQRNNPAYDESKKEHILASLYTYTEDQAAQHAFQVAAGLDSLVLGETQITGQFKEAMQAAKNNGTVGPILARLTQSALSEAKKVRTYTDIGKKPISISHAAIHLAKKVLGDVTGHKFMIIGAGDMAAVAAKYAVKYAPGELYVVNRTLSRAQTLVDEIKFGKALPLADLFEALPLVDIVISSTSAGHVILERDKVNKALTARANRPLFLVDIALPRDIDPRCGDLDDTYLFDIDDLKQIVGEHREARQAAAIKAGGMILEGVLNFMKWYEAINLKPALSGFKEYLDDLFDREVNRTLNKEMFKQLNDSQVDAIKKLLTSIAGKISSDASSRVRTPPDGFFQDQLATALGVLFPSPRKAHAGHEDSND